MQIVDAMLVMRIGQIVERLEGLEIRLIVRLVVRLTVQLVVRLAVQLVVRLVVQLVVRLAVRLVVWLLALRPPALALSPSGLTLLLSPAAEPAHTGPPEDTLLAISQLSSKCAAARESSLARPPIRSASRVVRRSS